MRKLLPFLGCLCFLILSGCRCGRVSSSAYHRTASDLIDARSRSVSQLWDSLAERQTIRIEYWWPYPTGSESYAPDCMPLADSTNAASIVGRDFAGGPGGGAPAIKSIEIVTERHSGSSMTSSADSSVTARASTEEARQSEQSSEARHDNGAVAIVAVAVTFAALCYWLIKEAVS